LVERAGKGALWGGKYWRVGETRGIGWKGKVADIPTKIISLSKGGDQGLSREIMKGTLWETGGGL